MLPSDHLQHHDDVIAQQSGENLVIFQMDSGHYYSLNEMGSRIWHLCDGSRSFSDVVDTLEAEYDASREQIEQDSLALTLGLIENSLLEIRSADRAVSE